MTLRVDQAATLEARTRQLRGQARLHVVFCYPGGPRVVRPERARLANVGLLAAVQEDLRELGAPGRRRGCPYERVPAEKARHLRRKRARAARRANR